MSRHEAVNCDSCFKSNFRIRRFKCLICFDYDLCGPCYDKQCETSHHKANHPMQCILTRSDYPTFYDKEQVNDNFPCSFTCPQCGDVGYSELGLLRHVSQECKAYLFGPKVICPICASGYQSHHPNRQTSDLSAHLRKEHNKPLHGSTTSLQDKLSKRFEKNDISNGFSGGGGSLGGGGGDSAATAVVDLQDDLEMSNSIFWSMDRAAHQNDALNQNSLAARGRGLRRNRAIYGTPRIQQQQQQPLQPHHSHLRNILNINNSSQQQHLQDVSGSGDMYSITVFPQSDQLVRDRQQIKSNGNEIVAGAGGGSGGGAPPGKALDEIIYLSSNEEDEEPELCDGGEEEEYEDDDTDDLDASDSDIRFGHLLDTSHGATGDNAAWPPLTTDITTTAQQQQQHQQQQQQRLAQSHISLERLNLLLTHGATLRGLDENNLLNTEIINRLLSSRDVEAARFIREILRLPHLAMNGGAGGGSSGVDANTTQTDLNAASSMDEKSLSYYLKYGSGTAGVPDSSDDSILAEAHFQRNFSSMIQQFQQNFNKTANNGEKKEDKHFKKNQTKKEILKKSTTSTTTPTSTTTTRETEMNDNDLITKKQLAVVRELIMKTIFQFPDEIL